MPSIATLLKTHRLASPNSNPTDFVFSSERGTAMNHRNIERRGHDAAAEAAGLNRPGVRKLILHDLRATFASLLIAHGADVEFVSRQLGHSSPEITLRFYARLFDKARHAEKMSAALEASFGAMLMSSPGTQVTPETSGRR
jgi:integrase